jgi:hypothetical protein
MELNTIFEQAVKEHRHLIHAVKSHALANYGLNGWDYVIECWSDAHISEVIGNSRTERGAIRKVGKIVKIQGERRQDAMLEVF